MMNSSIVEAVTSSTPADRGTPAAHRRAIATGGGRKSGEVVDTYGAPSGTVDVPVHNATALCWRADAQVSAYQSRLVHTPDVAEATPSVRRPPSLAALATPM